MAAATGIYREEVPCLPHRGHPLRPGVLPASGRLCVPRDCARRLGRPTTFGDPRGAHRDHLDRPGSDLDSLHEYQVFGAVAIATLGWLWGVGDTYIAELFPTVLRGTGFGIAVGGGRVVSIAAPTVIGWAIMHYGLQTPYLALAGLWVLTAAGYLMGPETKGKELEDLTDEALAEDLRRVP